VTGATTTASEAVVGAVAVVVAVAVVTALWVPAHVSRLLVRRSDVVNSLIAMDAQAGRLPRWPLANVLTGCMSGCVVAALTLTTRLKSHWTR
jgi:hypothetical protein